MEVRWSGQKVHAFRTPMLAVGIFKGTRTAEGVLKELNTTSKGWIAKVLNSGDIQGKKGDILIQQTFGALPSTRVMFLGLGERDRFKADDWRDAASQAAQACRKLGVRRFGVSLDLSPGVTINIEDLASAAVEGAMLGLYRFQPYRSDTKDENSDPEEMTLLPGATRRKSRLDDAIKEAQTISHAVCWVRDLVSQPGNRMTPGLMAAQATVMAKKWGIRYEILEDSDLQRLGMGGLLGVASGSKEPPRMIVLEHRTVSLQAPKVALVGKGITFDSGGISLKPAEKMDLMKSDMAGGAVVLGVMQVAARLHLPVHLIGLVPATENLPSGAAYKPGDVLTTMSGQTIEVANTDAEGRVVLADALAYAGRYKPDLILDLATLTGACVVALGDLVAGMMGSDAAVLEELKKSGERVGEAVWPLPLPEEYEEYIKSDIADVKNAGGRMAGAIQGGLFLKKFVKDTPWVHVDIAGPVWTDRDRGYRPKGATGFGVRLIVDFLRNYKKC
jgi:leucyl aminopeptidase